MGNEAHPSEVASSDSAAKSKGNPEECPGGSLEAHSFYAETRAEAALGKRAGGRDHHQTEAQKV